MDRGIGGTAATASKVSLDGSERSTPSLSYPDEFPENFIAGALGDGDYWHVPDVTTTAQIDAQQTLIGGTEFDNIADISKTLKSPSPPSHMEDTQSSWKEETMPHPTTKIEVDPFQLMGNESTVAPGEIVEQEGEM